MGKPGADRARSRGGRLAALTGLILATAANAGAPEVVGIEVEKVGGDSFRVSATLRHGDEGWDHYADGWVVLDEAGNVLGDRVLAHPHVDEQPFTRSLTVTIPAGVERIRVRPRDSVHGEGEPGEWITVER